MGRGGAGRDRARRRRRACPAARASGARAGRRRRGRSAPRAAAGRSARPARRAAPPTPACRDGRRRARRSSGRASGVAQMSATSTRYGAAARRRRRRSRPPRPPRSTSPRATSSRSTPARFKATRWPASARSTGCVVDLRRRGSARSAAREHGHRSALLRDARPERARDHRPGAADAEHAVDVQAQRAARPPRRAAPPRASRPRATRRGPRPCARRRRRSPLPAAAKRPPRPPAPATARSDLVTATTPDCTPKRGQHGGVLARLGHHAVVGGDDHQVQVDPGRAGDHRAHEALVAGHVDDAQAPSTPSAAARSRARSRSRAPSPPAAGRCPCR